MFKRASRGSGDDEAQLLEKKKAALEKKLEQFLGFVA